VAYVQVFANENNTFQFIIEDDGIGMGNITKLKGIGLQNIESRAKLSKFKLSMDSNPTGTNFILETPKKFYDSHDNN
jgi:signal transduction histidine kinase